MGAPEDPEADEAALVVAAQRGDVRAIERLLLRHEASVFRVLRFMGIAARDREDVAQDVLLRVFKHIRRVDPARPFSAWIYRVTINAARDHRQRHVRGAGEEQPFGDGYDPADSATGPEALAAEAMLRRRLEDAVARLSERERAVFVLKEIEGLDTAHIARALGVTRITVRRHLGLARRRLLALMGGAQRKKFPDR